MRRRQLFRLAVTTMVLAVAISEPILLAMTTDADTSARLFLETVVQEPMSPGPGYNDTSEFLIGRVAVGVFLVESVGSEFDWTDPEIGEVLSAVHSALDWWASLEPMAHISFSVEPHLRVGVTVEPTRESLNNDAAWISGILHDMGYDGSDPWSQTRQFNNNLRDRLGTDWAYSMFIAKGDSGAFANGEYGHGNYGGPWLTFAFASARFDAGSLVKRSAAHETGHIFYATDEYNGIVENSGYLNCPDSEGSDAIMGRNLTLEVSEGTRCQVGWADADENGVLDIVDLPPETTIERQSASESECQLWYNGTAAVVSRPNQNSRGSLNSVTVSRISRVEYRVSGGAWTSAVPSDGAFNGFAEPFKITTPLLMPGVHDLEVRSWNTEGNPDLTPEVDSMSMLSSFCSEVETLPALLDEPTFPVTAGGLGSISRVELWFSLDGHSFRLHGTDVVPPWEWVFDAATAGGEGNYTFYSIATEISGDRESPPPWPDAGTVVDWTLLGGDQPGINLIVAAAGVTCVGLIAFLIRGVLRRGRSP